MKENFILIAVPAVAVLVILLLLDALRRRRNASSKLPAESQTRLLQPDWAFYERHLQRPVPAALRELFSDIALLSASASFHGKREGISSFEPLIESGLLETHDEIGYDIVPFATSGCGDPIYLEPGPGKSDKVYIAYHDDPGNVEVFAESVARILESGRQGGRVAGLK